MSFVIGMILCEKLSPSDEVMWGFVRQTAARSRAMINTRRR